MYLLQFTKLYYIKNPMIQYKMGTITNRSKTPGYIQCETVSMELIIFNKIINLVYSTSTKRETKWRS